MSQKFRLSPELSDGSTPWITDSKSAVLEAVKMWCDEVGDVVGEHCEIEIINMSDEEFEALPDL